MARDLIATRSQWAGDLRAHYTAAPDAHNALADARTTLGVVRALVGDNPAWLIAMADRQRELFEDLPELELPPDLAGGYVLPSAPAPRGESPPGNCRCYKCRHPQRHGDSPPVPFRE